MSEVSMPRVRWTQCKVNKVMYIRSQAAGLGTLTLGEPAGSKKSC